MDSEKPVELSTEELAIRREDDRALFPNGNPVEQRVDNYLLVLVDEEQRRRLELLYMLLRKKPKTKKKKALSITPTELPTAEALLEHFLTGLRKEWHHLIDADRRQRLLGRIQTRLDEIQQLYTPSS